MAAYPCTESSSVSRGIHEGVHLVDTLHLLHDTKRRVSLDVVGLVKPGRDGLVQSPNCFSSAGYQRGRGSSP